MTIEEFETHRPKLYKSLSEFLADTWDDPGTPASDWELDFEVEPMYSDSSNVLFVTRCTGLSPIWYIDGHGWVWETDLPLA